METYSETHWHGDVAPTFSDIVFGEHYMGGEHAIIFFDNRYGASIIRTMHSYGGTHNLYEIACLNSEGDLVYDTEFSVDVRGWLTEDDVTECLQIIHGLTSEETV